MKKTELKNIDLTLYEETLDNGLKIYVVPKDNVNATYVTFSTDFGSVQDEFIPIDDEKMISVPKGIAHFLEHKVFEQEEGIDPFTFYSERGCDCNANTSNYKTTYLFSGTDYIEEGINYLLDFVQQPYFTTQNVTKEQGIIEQEIKMYDDIPFWKIYDGLTYNAFNNHPIKYPIAGTVKSINEITKDTLYNCYNTFYHPANMFVVVTGNINPEYVINIIKENQSKKKFDDFKEIILKKYEEKDNVAKTLEKCKMDIAIPKVGVGYKINIDKTNMDKNELNSYLKLLIDIKTGPTSEFAETLKKQGIINNTIDYITIVTNQHIFIQLHATTNKVDEYLQQLDKEMQNIALSESDFNRKKKVAKSAIIYNSESIYQLNERIMDNIIDYGHVIIDEIKLIDDMSIDKYNKIKDSLDLSNKTVYIIESNN